LSDPPPADHKYSIFNNQFSAFGGSGLGYSLYETTLSFLMIKLTAFQASGGWIKQRTAEYRISNRRIMKDGIAALCLLN